MNTDILNSCVQHNPLSLLTITDYKSIEYVNNLLPYSVGFEIECDKKETYQKEDFSQIPYILDVNVDSTEQRYRIPNGLAGMVCLYLISAQLKKNSELNPGSGIHYHVDLVDDISFSKIQTYLKDSEREEKANWMLHELDLWEYKGTYNHRRINSDVGGGVWVRMQKDFKTIEIRIGEMTFDYNLLIRRILHCNQIVRKLRSYSNAPHIPTFIKVEKSKIVNYLSSYSLVSSTGDDTYKLKTMLDRLSELDNLTKRMPTLNIEEKRKVVLSRTKNIS